MTDATFQTSVTQSKSIVESLKAMARSSASLLVTLFNTQFTNSSVDVDATLAARARRESARRTADNLLR